MKVKEVRDREDVVDLEGGVDEALIEPDRNDQELVNGPAPVIVHPVNWIAV